MAEIRLFHPGDEPALAEICLRTADAGSDATGVLADDDLWAEIFVLPYVQRHPDLAFVLADEEDWPIGYVVAAPDTRAFEEWFAEEWWPRHAERWPMPTENSSRQDALLLYAYGRRSAEEPYADTHPAHVHIDLLPEAQGQGWGRRLIETVADALRERGVSGFHLVVDGANTGALTFYDRLGLLRVPSKLGEQAFIRDL
jgi:ribosomal protein S18 acetylase RimI-like enzyme